MRASALLVVAGYSAEEQAVFFARARRLTARGRHGLDLSYAGAAGAEPGDQGARGGRAGGGAARAAAGRGARCCAPLVPLCHRPKR